MKQKFKFILLLLIVIAFGLVGCKKKTPAITEFNALGNWKAGGEEVYNITTNTTEKLSFEYDKKTHPDAKLESAPITDDLSGLKKMVLEVQGVGSISLQLVNKENSYKEVRINVMANKGTYEWNLIPEADFLKTITKIVIIASPDKEKSTGNVEITQMKFFDSNADNFIIQTGFDNIPSNENEYDGVSKEFNFNDKWEIGVEDDAGVYTITKEQDITKVSFDKPAGKEWAFIQSRVKGDFKKFNYVVVTLKGTKDQTVIVKAKDGTEKSAKFIDEETTVVVDISKLTDAEKNAINAIFIFGLPGATGKGSFDIISAYMTDEYEIVEEIIKNKYNGTDETFSLINWYDNGDYVYEITNSETETIIKYNKKQENQHWSTAVTFLEGNISNFEILEIVITGEVGKKAMFKIEGGGGNIETPIEFDGTKQTIKIRLDKLTKEQLQAVDKVLLFASPGGIGSGTLTIHNVTFAMDTENYNTGWADNNDEVYEVIDNTDGTVTVNYNKKTFEWASLIKEFGEEAERFNTFTLVLKGTTGKEILVKLNGKIEKSFTFGEEDLVVEMTDDNLQSILLFAEPGKADVEGVFTIVSINLSKVVKDPVDPSIEVDVNQDWKSNDEAVYTFEENEDGSVVVNYDKTINENDYSWTFFANEIKQNLANHNTLVLKVKGTLDKEILIKANDDSTMEKWVTFDGTEQEIIIPLNKPLTKILIFAEAGKADAVGSFEIISAKVVYKINPEGVDVNDNWLDNGDEVYSFTKNDDVVTVSYQKADHGWAFFKVELDMPVFYYNTLTLVVKGENGKKILVKPNDDGALEEWITFDGTEQTVEFILNRELSKIFIFAEPDTIDVSGSFDIISAKLTYVNRELNVNVAWTTNNDSIYDFVYDENGVSVTYERTTDQLWEFIKTTFSGYTKDKTNLIITINGQSGLSLIIKPNDNNALEQSVELTGADQVLEFTFTDTPVNILIFVDPIGGSLNGSFVIKDATLS